MNTEQFKRLSQLLCKSFARIAQECGYSPKSIYQISNGTIKMSENMKFRLMGKYPEEFKKAMEE